MENFIKFVPCTPFQGTLPGELAEKLGCPGREVGVASPSFFAPGSSLAVTTSAAGALMGSRGQLGGTGSEGSGHRGRPEGHSSQEHWNRRLTSGVDPATPSL